MVPLGLFSFVSRGTGLVRSTRMIRLVAGINLPITPIMSLLIYEKSNYATMRFESEASHSANNGLHVARGIMEEIKKEFDWISYGDLWTLGGVAAIQVRL